jgi:hypothetical protein
MSFNLAQNYPNPFNPVTTINFTLPKAGKVSLKIYNMLGQEVATLIDGHRTAGLYNVKWNAENFASGMYIYRLTSGTQSFSNKMLLIK